jgi:hypothetical protein
VLTNRVFAGDQVLSIDGMKIENAQQLNKILNGPRPTATVKLRHAFFSFCLYNGTTIERLQLEPDVFKPTGRAVDLFTASVEDHSSN